MTDTIDCPRGKPFDLEERTERFAARIRTFLHHFPRTSLNEEDCQQLLRSSGSVAANYIEANEALGKDDFLMRIRISLKEAKESRLWLSLLIPPIPETKEEIEWLRSESHQLVRIFSTIIRNTQKKWGRKTTRAYLGS